MKQHAVKLEITNSVNDDRRLEWLFCNAEVEKNFWIDDKKREQKEWNNDTHGAMSHRYYSFSEYTVPQLMSLPIGELEGATLGQIFDILK